MIIKPHTSKLLELIRYANKDKSLELEARVKGSQKNQITSDVFFNVMKRLKGISDIKLLGETTELDIGLSGDYNDIRVTIIGDQHITDYCQKNEIKLLNPAAVMFMRKVPVRYVDINEYHLRFNLKREEMLPPNDRDVSDLLKNWTRMDKTFRYKKRFSFITNDGQYRFDLTSLKSSSKRIVKGKSRKVAKSEVKPYMVKYVVKPEYVVDKKDWFDKLADNTKVELMGKNYAELQYFKTMQKSQVLKNELEYEIEVEYLGNKERARQSSSNGDKQILVGFLQRINTILQAVQKSYYVISEIEKTAVIDQYKAIMGDYKFNGPMNVSITLQNVVEKNYEEYVDSINIRKGYSVTDKADGERNLLLILNGGDMFLLNRKNQVRKLDARCPSLQNSIFDVEYVIKDKKNNNVNMLLIFDVYFVNGEDVRSRILNRTSEEIKKDIIPQSRYEIMVEKMAAFESDLQKKESNTLEIIRKKFFFGDDEGVDNDTVLDINRIKAYMTSLDKDSDEYRSNLEQLSLLKADTKIFKEANKIYNKEYPYHIDGLVFTPRSLTVGDEPDREKRDPFNGRWYRCFKWKPPEENTIDFLGVFKKEEGTNNFAVKYVTKGDSVIECRIMVLHVGYNPVNHTRYNSFKVLNENVTFESGYNPVPFAPVEPYIREIHICYLPIENGNCYTSDGNIISDNSIIEFSYNNSKPSGFCWIPLRNRDNLKPNDFITANNVWSSIFNPVTLSMITSGNIASSSNVYFDNTKKRSNKKSKAMNDFHSFVKKKLLKDNLLGKKTLLDIGVGKAGDMNHWLDAGCSMVVGLDSVKDNLDNSNDGACNRILSRYGTLGQSNNKTNDTTVKNLLDNTMMIWADCSKNVLSGEAANDDLSKYYLDILYGRVNEVEITNSKLKNFYNQGKEFDMVVANFSIHYFFESEDILKTTLSNVSNSLQNGGRFVCTTLDGNKVFDALRNDRVYYSSELAWKITKTYDADSFPPSVNSLGLTIDVYVASIGQTIQEYLVNSEYFETVCREFNLQLVEKKSFEEVFNGEAQQNDAYGDMVSMGDDYKTFSFMNMLMVFEKVDEE